MRPLLSLCALCLARVSFSTQPPLFPLLRASVVAATYATICALLLGGIVGSWRCSLSPAFCALLRATVLTAPLALFLVTIDTGLVALAFAFLFALLLVLLFIHRGVESVFENGFFGQICSFFRTGRFRVSVFGLRDTKKGSLISPRLKCASPIQQNREPKFRIESNPGLSVFCLAVFPLDHVFACSSQ